VVREISSWAERWWAPRREAAASKTADTARQ